jgi:SAM-dependent methyltransferase
LEPGRTVGFDCVVRSPNTPGAYALELDLVHGNEAWFRQHGSETTRREITVGGMRPDQQPEIDYEQVYAAADLTKDYWLVSGPASAEEFRHIGLVKRQIIEGVGLRPDSRVLDVGCGTGSLTGALADFLGSEGLYYGTDLSEIAVQFCREKYARPNFFFTKNGMTTVPIEDQRFDFIVFFSVFTHTYPAETRELLAEATRLLNDGGSIIADVFESDIDGHSVGTRAMIVLDRRRMLDLAAAQGLEASTLSTFTWDSSGPLPIDRVMRRFSKPTA